MDHNADRFATEGKGQNAYLQEKTRDMAVMVLARTNTDEGSTPPTKESS
jgi:hypothetical protein